MIHCVNLNATQDLLFLLPGLRLGQVNRAAALLQYPGGKGNNCARAVALLGHKPSLHAFIGASERSKASAFFKKQGVAPRLQVVPGTDRPCLVLMNADKDEETVINSPSRLKLGPGALESLVLGLLRAIKPGDLVTLSGGLPEGLKPDTFKKIIARVQARGAVALLDSYGPGLKEGVEAAPFLVKPNVEELGQTFAWRVNTRDQILDAARKLLRKGPRCVVVTLGARGAIACTQRESLFAHPLPLTRGFHSPVGCGDAFLGGLTWALHKGEDLATCLRWGTASAWANLQTPGAVFYAKGVVQAQCPRVRISRLA